MAYNVNKSDGALLVTVADRSVNASATTIKLVGRDLSNYGEVLNENLVHMLEHFSSPLSPANPLLGQIWYDSATNFLNYYSNTGWVPISTGGSSVIGGLNIGSGAGIFSGLSANIMDFKTLVGGSGINLSSTANTVTISSTLNIDLSGGVVAGQVLKWSGVAWVPGTDETGGGGSAASPLPAGTIFASASVLSVPFLLCDGSAVSRTTYNTLFSRIGTTYGAGDGATTFNVPNLSGRFPLGSNSIYSIATTGGADEVALTTNQLPVHTHTGTTSADGSHTHSVNGPTRWTGDNNGKAYFQSTSSGGTSYTGVDNPLLAIAVASHTHSFTTGSAGLGQTHENMPPYLSIYWYIAAEDVGGSSSSSSVNVKANNIAVGNVTTLNFAPGLTVVLDTSDQVTVSKSISFAKIQYKVSSGLAGGTATSGSWITRPLNTIEYNTIGATLLSNQITLAAGTYSIEIWSTGYKVNNHRARFRNITDSSTTVLGSSSSSNTTDGDNTLSIGKGIVTIASTKTFELQYRVASTQSSNGLGIATSFGDDEIYADVWIEKLG